MSQPVSNTFSNRWYVIPVRFPDKQDLFYYNDFTKFEDLHEWILKKNQIPIENQCLCFNSLLLDWKTVYIDVQPQYWLVAHLKAISSITVEWVNNLEELRLYFQEHYACRLPLSPKFPDSTPFV